MMYFFQPGLCSTTLCNWLKKKNEKKETDMISDHRRKVQIYLIEIEMRQVNIP